MVNTVSFISTGQSPRDDIMYDIVRHLSPQIEIRECGALDNLTIEQIATDLAPKEGEASTTARVRDMSMMVFSYEKVIQLMQQKIDEEIAAGSSMIVILCTSKFPPFKSSVPIIELYDLMHRMVPSLMGNNKIGALFPFDEYAKEMGESWEDVGVPVVYKTVPSKDANKQEYIDYFRNAGVEMIVMDCIGYSYATKKFYSEQLNIPIIHPRSLLVSTIHDLLNI